MEGQPAQQGRAPSLACKSGGAGLQEFWQPPAGLNVWNVKGEQLCSRRAGRVRGHGEGEFFSTGRQSSARRGNKGAGKRYLPLPSPSRNPKGNQFLSQNMLAPRKHPTLCFCGSIPPVAGLTPSQCCRASPEGDHRRKSELSLPLLPLCTLLIHPS